MKQILAILTLSFFLGCKTELRETIASYPNGNVMTEYVYAGEANKKDYNINEYFENGQTKFKGTVKDDKFIGVKLNYYDNGNLREVDSIVNPCVMDFCCCDGKVFKYYRNGKLEQTFENQNGLANGLVSIYDGDSLGKVTKTSEYKDDKKNGKETLYYESGKVLSISEFKNDTAINYTYYFKENGDTLKYLFQHKGKQCLPAKKWLNNGQIFYATYVDTSQKIILYRWTDKSGQEIKRETFVSDKEFVLPD